MKYMEIETTTTSGVDVILHIKEGDYKEDHDVITSFTIRFDDNTSRKFILKTSGEVKQFIYGTIIYRTLAKDEIKRLSDAVTRATNNRALGYIAGFGVVLLGKLFLDKTILKDEIEYFYVAEDDDERVIDGVLMVQKMKNDRDMLIPPKPSTKVYR
jgi:hypothetical protein